MDAHCSPERPETRKLVHSTAQTRPGRTQSTLRGTARPTHNHGKIETQTCGGEIATAPAVALMMASRAASSRTLPAHSNRADGECCACQIDRVHGRRDAGTWACDWVGIPVRTAALAAQEGPPSPAVRPGPIHGMGRAVHYRVHALTGLASAKRNAEDEDRPTSARTFFARPAQADEVESAR